MPMRSAVFMPPNRGDDIKLPPRSHGATGAVIRCRLGCLVMMFMVASRSKSLRSKKKTRAARDRVIPLRDKESIADALDLSRPACSSVVRLDVRVEIERGAGFVARAFLGSDRFRLKASQFFLPYHHYANEPCAPLG